MNFNEKFNLLMKMVHTTNFELAEVLEVDPSLISRWRTGERQVGNSSPYLPKIAQYFAQNAQEDFQKVAILELTGHHWEDKGVGERRMTKYLSQWLVDEPYIDPKSLTTLIDTIGNSANYYPSFETLPLPFEPGGEKMTREIFMGKKGLRQATTKLLLQAIRKENSGKSLQLFSNEPMDWITEDVEFARLWSYLAMKGIKNKIKIEIIHTLERQPKELIQAIEKWLPLYLTGAVKSYYYPSRKDNLFYHTSFYLEGVAMVRGNTVKGEADENFTYSYSDDPSQLNLFSNAFHLMKKGCRPLVNVFTEKNIKRYLAKNISFFTNPKGDVLTVQSDLLSGMDNALLERFFERGKLDLETIETIIGNNNHRVEQINDTPGRSFKLVMSLPRITDVRKGIVPAIVPELLSGRTFFYTPEEYKDHLKNLIELMEKIDNFEVLLFPRKHIIQSVQLYVIKDQSMVVFKHTTPRFAFISEQSDLIKAMESFINNAISRIPKRNSNKEAVIQTLSNFITKIG